MVMALQAGWKENTIAAILVAEAGIDGREGMECVAEVMLNRSLRGVDLLSLVNSNVFSSLRGTTPTRLFNKATREDPKRLNVALEISEVLLHRPDKLPRRVNGATHFCQVRNHPWWSKEMKVVAVIRNHKFYRE